MAYTASALGFMFENLTKPIVVTGSQLPIYEQNTDAVDNFLGALLFAGTYKIHEVAIYFADRLLRGCRATKNSTNQFPAFESPNYSLLAEVGVEFKIHWDKIRENDPKKDLLTFRDFDSEVHVVSIQPYINAKSLASIISVNKAIILLAYGMGGMRVQVQAKNPDGSPKFDKDGNAVMIDSPLMNAITAAIKAKKLVVVMTQCARGNVSSVYEVGQTLIKKGAVLAEDMTVEAVLAKVSYLLGKQNVEKFSFDELKKRVGQNLRGELTPVSDTKAITDGKVNEVAQAVSKVFKTNDKSDHRMIRSLIKPLMASVASNLVAKK